MKLYTQQLQKFALILVIILIQTATFGATYYSDPASKTVQLTNQPLEGGWGTTAAGPFNQPVTIKIGDQVVIQEGSVVTIPISGQSINIIQFAGGTLVVAAGSFNCVGSIMGKGILTNVPDNATRIKMQGNNKTINAVLTGGGGLTIAKHVALAGNTSISGRISIDAEASLDLGNYSLSIDNLIMKNNTSLLQGSDMASLEIKSTNPNSSSLYMDSSKNHLGNLSIDNAGGIVIGNGLQVNNLVLTNGKINLTAGNLKVKSITGGSPMSFIATEGNSSVSADVAAGATFLFPIGAVNEKKSASLDAVSITPTQSSTFTVSVKTTLSNEPASASKVGKREWSVASTQPSETKITFSPKYPSGTKKHVIGLYTLGVWTEISATRNENNFTATTNTFGLFATGDQGGFVAN